jgi:GH35 family endo-1,4-beta-xylanase
MAQSILTAAKPGASNYVSAWVRLASGPNQTALLTVQKTDGDGTTYQNVASGTVSSSAWTQLSGPYSLTVSGTLSTLNLYVEGPPAGTNFYVDDFTMDGPDWKMLANARIEQIRKRDARLLVTDANGNPVPGVAINLSQTRHAFAFGSAINGNISNPQYAGFVKTNFEWAVMENEAKWYSNEPSQGFVTYTAADNIVNFCRANKITLRGHNIFWAVDSTVQQWVQNLSNADLLVAVTNRLNSVVNHFKGTFVHWDVNNEMLHGNFYGNRLGDWVNPWMFQYTHMLDSNVVLFVNDYNVVAGNETDAYKQQIQSLLSSNAPVQAIGAQGHFGSTIDPTTTESRLDSLAQLGLPVWITEYDSLNADENVRANNLETLYRLAFSKQAVDGVIMWGFWAGSHWRGSNAAIVNLDWTLNEAGRRYQSLLTEWTTKTNGTTDAVGALDFRGFHGSYDITLTPPGGPPTLRRITLDPGAGTNTYALVINLIDSRPVIHNVKLLQPDGKFAFQLSGNAGHTNQIQISTTLADWSLLTNVFNASGTLSFTNPSPATQLQLYFRARELP